MVLKIFIPVFIFLTFFFNEGLFAQNTKAQEKVQTNNINFAQMLKDPEIQQYFNELKTAAKNASIETKNNIPTISEKDIANLDRISTTLINRLHEKFKLDASLYRVHTYLSRYKINSCLEYYNSLARQVIGKDCNQYPSSFANCQQCNDYIKILEHRPKDNIIEAYWWQHAKIIALVDVLQLQNKDEAYIGLEITTKKQKNLKDNLPINIPTLQCEKSAQSP